MQDNDNKDKEADKYWELNEDVNHVFISSEASYKKV